MGWFFRKYPSPPPPPPPLKKKKPCVVCERKIIAAHVEVKHVDGLVLGRFILVDPVVFCPFCGRKLKEDPQ